MKWLIIIVVGTLAVIFIGGGIDVGSQPMFGHVDTILKTNAFMGLHEAVFFFLYRGEGSAEEGYGKTREDLDDFQRAPLGFDKRKHYKELDEAAE